MSERQAPEDQRLALPASLRARVLGDVAAAPAPRAARNVGRYGLLAAGIAWIALRAWLEQQRPDWEALPASASWAPLVDALLVAALVSVLALSRGKAMVGPSARALLLATLAPVVITATVLLLAVPTAATDAASLAAGGASFWPAALRCGSGALAVGVPVTLLLVAAQRRLVFASPALVGAAAGIAAASWAHAILHWGCPIAGAGHVMVGHALPTVPLAALGALVGWWIDRRSLRGFTRGGAR
jgi:hypothetical protein